MKAIVFSREQSDGPTPEGLPGLARLRLADVPVPDFPNARWVLINSKIAGICGSDIGFLQGKPMPAAAPYFQLPVIPGHELFGEVAALGKKVHGLHVGQRVSIDPTLACRERGFTVPCPQCRHGHPGTCERMAEGILSPGILIGTCQETGGGWGEYFVAPSHRCFPVPDAIDDDEASLLEPFSVCLRAVLNHLGFPAPVEPRSPPIARTMLRFLVVARRKMSILGAIAASGGRWSGRSVGSTSIDGWTACWNMARRLTGPSCESFALNTIWRPYFPDPNEF